MTALSLAIAVAGCGGPIVAPDLPFRRVASGSFGPSVQAEVMVIGDQASWDALLQRASPEAPPASVQFGTEMVVFISLGTRPSTGYRVRVERVVDRGTQIDVEAVEQTPHPSCGVATVLTQPFDAVAMERGTRAAALTLRAEPGVPCR